MYLSFKTGPRAGETVEVSGSDFAIGRDQSCDLVIDDEKASRRHLAIQALSGAAELSDLGSSNGTWVNGNRIVGSVSLAGGEHLRVGGTEFDVLITDPSAPVPTGAGDTFVGEARTAPEPLTAPEPSYSSSPPPPPPSWDPAPVGGPVPAAAVGPKRNSGKAIASLVLGIVSLILGIIPGVLAIVFASLANNDIRQQPDVLAGEGMATAGRIMGIIGVAFGVIGLIIFLS